MKYSEKDLYSEKELLEQEKVAKKAILLVFLSIAIFLIPICYYLSNDIDAAKASYEAGRNRTYHGKIIGKREEGDYTRAPRYISFEHLKEKGIYDKDIYLQIEIGDSIYKKEDSDLAYLILHKTDTIIIDDNRYPRERYFKLKTKADKKQ